ncbi:hypothetical protein L1049_016327 [Liquidambar formosana]|uniref:Uncharacterized protein n=1 Tax=Liquidambar formosana TaxID=63359 RepID=A0AAP0S672_LIQFO
MALGEDLKGVLHNFKYPSIRIGDFNQVLYATNKWGNHRLDLHGSEEFQAFIDDCAFIDLPAKGPTFTWTNNRDGEDCTYERLDSFLQLEVAYSYTRSNSHQFAYPQIRP